MNICGGNGKAGGIEVKAAEAFGHSCFFVRGDAFVISHSSLAVWERRSPDPRGIVQPHGIAGLCRTGRTAPCIFRRAKRSVLWHDPASMNEWNIQSRAHQCSACTKPFADRQAYHTLLSNDQAEQLSRMDVCDACWQSQFGNGVRERTGYVSHWQGVFEVPPAQPPEAIQKENAETLLRKLIERNEPRYEPAAYILAVMLERKRLLRVKEQIQREGRRIFVYEQQKTGDIFTIPDPNLHLNQLETVQQDVAELLEHGLPPLASANDPTVPSAPASEPPPAENPVPAANPPAPASAVTAPAAPDEVTAAEVEAL